MHQYSLSAIFLCLLELSVDLLVYASPYQASKFGASSAGIVSKRSTVWYPRGHADHQQVTDCISMLFGVEMICLSHPSMSSHPGTLARFSGTGPTCATRIRPLTLGAFVMITRHI